jgi:hypothetical protein
MDCAAATPHERLVQTESESRNSLFATVSRIDMQPEVCKEALGRYSLGQEYFAPLYSTVPTLFLSGTLDANTFSWQAGHRETAEVENCSKILKPNDPSTYQAAFAAAIN